MKNIISLLFLALYALQINAQNDLSFDPKLPSSDCFNCYNGIVAYEYNTGIKGGISFGLVKEITPKVDLTTSIGYQFWRYEISETYDQWGYVPVEPYKDSKHLFNLSIGQRFHFVSFEKASLYSGTQLNVQSYLNSYERNFSLSIEPSIGWKRSIGQKSECFVAVGYDQLLTSLSEFKNLRPGRVGINMGFNILLKKKTDVAETVE